MPTIRTANEGDADDLLTLITELADYEGMAGAMRASADDLRAAIRKQPAIVTFLMADWDGKGAGFCAYYPSFSTFLGDTTLFVEDVFVRPPCRKGGIGSSLLASVCGAAQEQGLKRVEWRVQASNAPAIAQFGRAGIEVTSDWMFCRLEERDIQDRASLWPAKAD